MLLSSKVRCLLGLKTTDYFCSDCLAVPSANLPSRYCLVYLRIFFVFSVCVGGFQNSGITSWPFLSFASYTNLEVGSALRIYMVQMQANIFVLLCAFCVCNFCVMYYFDCVCVILCFLCIV
jgi:hypothetical protein